ncbi:hypothetical protein ACQPW1_45610 [Nocardia sp. CA-128927]|uniref:hypothetical protein n=1 Tax=Nocardia sp. CA-128927 TaxID=3239975 RepID=UPI003D992FA8
MPRRIAGKIFYEPGEPGAAPPLTDAEQAEVQKGFDAFNAKVRKTDGQPPTEERTEENRRFWDDLSGTEYEGWTPERGSEQE